MTSALASSGIDALESKIDDDGISYHMRGLSHLGEVSRDGQDYRIAHVVFVRSSPPGQDTPPDRGHDFIVVFDGEFGISGYGRVEAGDYKVTEGKLVFGDKVVADFGATDPRTRYRGFPDIALDYPFADRINDADWDAGNF